MDKLNYFQNGNSSLKACKFEECPPGAFEYHNNLFFMSEYGSEAYCISSGEIFWGGAKSKLERAGLIVTPIDYDDLLAAWNRRTEPENKQYDPKFCTGCRSVDNDADDYPCNECRRAYTDKFEPKQEGK